jgi:hypothetical protein
MKAMIAPNQRLEHRTFLPVKYRILIGANTFPFHVDGGVVTFTHRLKFIELYLRSELSDSRVLDERIKSASAAFAFLLQQFFSAKYVQCAILKMDFPGPSVIRQKR